MRGKTRLKEIICKMYALLERKQKHAFAWILLIMAVSAGLTQFTPKAIGWLTDHILKMDEIEFWRVIPVLLAILVVNVLNEPMSVS